MNKVYEALHPSILNVMRRLESQGFETFVVGGFLRDLFLSRETSDIDLATAARPEEVDRVLCDLTVIPTGIQHGTVTVLVGDRSIEVTTFRKDGAYADHRHPTTVTYSETIEEDLSRRDFTINALAWNEKRGLLDPYGGFADLKRSVIRAVGDPIERFKEDALRILRALRLSSELQFKIDSACSDALIKHADLLHFVACERIREEWLRLIQGSAASQVMSQYANVLSLMIPGIAELQQKGLYDRSLMRLENVVKDPVMRLAAFFYDFGEDAAGLTSMLKQLRFDNATIDRVVRLTGAKKLTITTDRRSILMALHELQPDSFFDTLALRRAEVIAVQRGCSQGDSKEQKSNDEANNIDLIEQKARQILSSGDYLTLRDLAINGQDMLDAGYEGKTIGQKLEEALFSVMLEGVPNTKDAILRSLQKED